VYIEGLWVDPEHRDRKIASRSLAAFSRRVLDGSNAICGFVCAEDLKAQSVYRRAGFNIVDRYSKYYV
jgi:predicted GNAT family acetyltransferase